MVEVFLSLLRWYIGFDPLKNTPSNNLIWVKLPNLPLEMWSIESLIEIGNSINKFVYVDPWCRGEKDKRIVWILIEKVYKGGYPDHIEIAWGRHRIKQRLYFWGIPFRCSLCHRIGHLIKNYRRHHFPEKKAVHRRFGVASSLPFTGRVSSSSLSFLEVFQKENQDPGNLDPKLFQKSSPRDNAYGLDAHQPPQSNPTFIKVNRSPPFMYSPIPEPLEGKVVPSPPTMNLMDFVVDSHPIPISSSSMTPDKDPALVPKGKEPLVTITPFNSQESFPVNKYDSDIEFFLSKKSLELEPLTIHKPNSPASLFISPNSAKNIMVRKKNNKGSRHFRGRMTVSEHGVRNLSLIDVPI